MTTNWRRARGHELDRPFAKEGVCSGECCRMITLSVSPERIAIVAASERYLSSVGRVVGASRVSDAQFVESNFIPVRLDYVDPISGARREDPRPNQVYRCTAWDGATKRCSSYAERPNFCRSYGLPHHPCKRADCSLRYDPIWRDFDRWADDGGPQLPTEAQ